RQRRLVVRRPAARGGGLVPLLRRGPAQPAARAALPVCRLRPLAARLAARRGVGGAARLLAAAARRRAAAARAADRPAAAHAAVAGRRDPAGAAAGGAGRRLAGARPAP